MFPLAIKEGVTLKPANSNPVLIYQAVPSAEPLIRISAGAAGQTTTIRGMRLIGGAMGVDAHLATGASPGQRTLDLINVRFVRNEIGVSSVLNGALAVSLTMQTCVFEPTTLMFSGLPDGYRTPTRGIRLHALEETESAIPRIDAALIGLTLAPGYAEVAQSDFLEQKDVQVLGTADQISRFLEVYARGISAEHRSVNPVRSPVAEVLVNVNGGSFTNQDSMWDALFYGAARSQPQADGVQDHTCGYVATFTGATIEKFRQFGLYATSSRNARGELVLHGSTTVKETGIGETRSPGRSHFTGIHGFAYQGYLAIRGDDFASLGNLGHGLYMTAWETRMAPGEHPVGAYLGISNGRLHQNGGAGISLVNAYNEWGGVVPHGVTGGTWHDRAGFLTLVADGSDVTHLEHGQGVVDRCAISNNGEHGIMLRNNDLGSISIPSAINVRITNTAIWNHPLGGVVAFSDVLEFPHTTYLICPLILCTIAGNGSTLATDPFTGQIADYNVEYREFHGTTHDTEYIYEFTDPVLIPPVTIGTRFNNLILQRQAPGTGAKDFGSHTLMTELFSDNTDPNLVPDDRIGVAAVRADFPPGTPTYPRSGSEVAPFLGPLNWAGTDASMFFLTSSGSLNFFSKTWEFLLTGFTESSWDFLGVARDPLGDSFVPAAEKGAMERPNAP